MGNCQYSRFWWENISNVVENTSSYFNQNQKNVKNIYLSDFNEVSVSLYQLFNDITFKNTFIASSIIEANKEQNYGLSFRSSDINASIYINGNKVKSFDSGIEQDIEVFLNEGSNRVLIIGKDSVNTSPLSGWRFIMKHMDR